MIVFLIIPGQPRSNGNNTIVPYTTLCRSAGTGGQNPARRMRGLRVLAREGSGRSRPRGGGEGAGRRRLLTRPRRDPAFVGATSAASSSEWPATTHLGQKLAAEALPQGDRKSTRLNSSH